MPKSLNQEIYTEIKAARALLVDLGNLGIASLYPDPVENTHPSAESGESLQGDSLESISNELEGCVRCDLSKGRNTIVFGVGNPSADIVFVGEGPGRDEDLQGEPFVGEAGRLLDRIILSMGFRREEVYICNVVKCRPPSNRDPQPLEIEACEPFLLRQIEAIQPRLIVALGKFAAQTLLRSDNAISRLRGKWHTYHDIPLMPTFHPAYLLRNPASKRDVWEDMKQALQKLRQVE